VLLDAGTWTPTSTEFDIAGWYNFATCCVLPSGAVLYATWNTQAPANTLTFYEYTGTPPATSTTLALTAFPPLLPTSILPLLLLPTGQVLCAVMPMALYTPDATSTPDASWLPEIVSAPGSLIAGGEYTLTGRKLNGMSQAVSLFGNAAAATNYPLVRLTTFDGSRVWHCRTHDHSSMGLATGATIGKTHFTVPRDYDGSPVKFCVIANGLADMACQPLHIPTLPPQSEATGGIIIGSLADGGYLLLLPGGGVIPVPPWEPDVLADLVRAAAHHGVQALQGLQSVVASGAPAAGTAQPQAPAASAAPVRSRTGLVAALVGVLALAVAAGLNPFFSAIGQSALILNGAVLAVLGVAGFVVAAGGLVSSLRER
jgi:hypothetical protein